ncbi:hypothetical protein DICVIV_14265 [Dictyocaulus viviparus]|uniref:Uncharacterized protein n=1 Tax=Dictyocaulus viviparus TaxID=29172 RepID=A0A0D8X5N2_DICVI|nr:hypothetical protein DICVIV_14265 [Dictyocaulus viviparus]
MKRRFTGIPVQRTFNGMPLQNGWMTPSPLCSPPTPLCSDASPLFQYTLNNRFSPYGQVVDPLPVLPVDEVERILRDIENEPQKPVKRARKKRETSTKKKSPPQSSPSALQIQKITRRQITSKRRHLTERRR